MIKYRFDINIMFYYISFLLLLVAMVSIVSLFQLGGAIDIIIKENLPSTIAGEKMSENLTRIHLLILNNQASVLREYNSDIDILAHDITESLIEAKNNVTISGEGDIIRDIGTNFRRYREIVASSKERGFSSDTKHALSELFRKNVGLIKQLMSINNQAMVNADETAKSLAKSRSIWMIFLAFIGFVSVFFLTRTIKNKFSVPISDMLLNLRRVNFGDNTVRLCKRDGELGELSEYINNLLDAKNAVQSNTLNYAFEQRDLLSALVEINSDPFFVYDVGYKIVLSNEKARNILRRSQTKDLEHKLRDSIQEEESLEIQFKDILYRSRVSVLRDRGFNKIGYTIALLKTNS